MKDEKAIKRHYCGNGEGMFEDSKGAWVRYEDVKHLIEFANQQPEVECTCIEFTQRGHDYVNKEQWSDPNCPKHGIDKLKHEAKQPKQGEVDALQYNEMVQFLRKWNVDSDAIADLRGLIKSTLTHDKDKYITLEQERINQERCKLDAELSTQDKVREAAERVVEEVKKPSHPKRTLEVFTKVYELEKALKE